MAKSNVNVPEVEEQGERMYEVTVELTEENQPDEFISVNERTWKIKPGETVLLPECALRQLQHKKEMTKKKLAFINANRND